MKPGKAVEGLKIPEDAALLPFEEKARLIVQLRRQGKTYREIQKALKVSPRDVKRALKIEAHRDEIEELRDRVRMLEQRLLKAERSLAELEEIKEWLEMSLDRRFRHDPCVCLVDGFCTNWVWKSRVKGWSMKRTKNGYVLNVDKHRWMCALCPSFMSKSSMEAFEELGKSIKEAYRMLELILDKMKQWSRKGA